MKRPRNEAGGALEPLIAEALAAALGPVILLDVDLRVRLASAEAEAVLGSAVPDGIAAPALLCGDRPKRPVAEALAAGRPVQALVLHPDGGDRFVQVRSLPLWRGRKKIGWMLILSAVDQRREPENFHGMWARDPRMKRLFRLIEKVALDDVPVLVRGETGAGKELVAAALHRCSARRGGPFRAINCAALPPTLLESELFGHARGAFTGAVKDVPGHFQLAHKGTLFLDEVAELPLELQAKLLRVLEARVVTPVGARSEIPVDVRIVSATHRSLRAEVEAGRFRGDLMYRLRVIPLFLPPLREREGDVTLIVENMIEELNESKRRRIEVVSPAAQQALERYDWPGNVRELRNALAYAYAIGDGGVLELSDLPPEIVDAGPEVWQGASEVRPEPGDERARQRAGERPDDAKDDTKDDAKERERIERALLRASGNREQAARLLGVSRVTLWRRMKGLGIA
jgi:transcriptional regulator with PAS, ATPase and Fis domain